MTTESRDALVEQLQGLLGRYDICKGNNVIDLANDCDIVAGPFENLWDAEEERDRLTALSFLPIIAAERAAVWEAAAAVAESYARPRNIYGQERAIAAAIRAKAQETTNAE